MGSNIGSICSSSVVVMVVTPKNRSQIFLRFETCCTILRYISEAHFISSPFHLLREDTLMIHRQRAVRLAVTPAGCNTPVFMPFNTPTCL